MLKPLILTLALSSLSGSDEEWPPSDERLQEIAAEARAAVEATTQIDLEGLGFAYAERKEVAAALREENEATIRRQLAEGDDAEATLQQFTAATSSILLAKYHASADRVLLQPHLFVTLFGEEAIELRGEQILRALLVHECAHALQSRRYAYLETLTGLSTREAIAGFNALIEGHAEHVARQVCAARGWGQGFDEVKLGLGTVVGEHDPATRLIMELAAADLRAWYVQGEQFVDALVEAGGEEAVQAAFRAPPASMRLVEHPAWYLDPSLVPKTLFELEAALRVVAGEREGWRTQYITISPPQVRTALAGLPPATVARLEKHLLQNRAAVLMPADAPGSRMISMVLYEFDGAAEASYFATAAEQLMRLKDETFREGPVRIVEVTYESVAGAEDGIRGVVVTKMVDFRGQEVAVTASVLAHGSLAAELLHSNAPIEGSELVSIGRSLLIEAARRPAEPATQGEADGTGSDDD